MGIGELFMKKDMRARVPITRLFQLRRHIEFADLYVLVSTSWITFVGIETYAFFLIKEGPHE